MSESGDELARRTLRRWMAGGFLANFTGTCIVFGFLAFAAPSLLDPEERTRLVERSAIVLGLFLAVLLPVVYVLRRRQFAPIAAWLGDERPASSSERKIVLDMPMDAVRATAPFWLIGAVIFALVGAGESRAVGIYIGVTVLLGGVTTCAIWYLLVERIMRPITARALTADPPERPAAPGVAARLTMSWALATAVPLLGVAALAVGYLADVGFEAERSFAAALLLVGLALAVGLFATLIAARSVSDPLGAMRRALVSVKDGDFAVRVPIDDASEVGLLQAGFNEMTAGLAEREQIRKTFGTYVDREVADHILREGTALEGEEVEVTVMFVDIRNFTGIAERSEAREVVATINRLFERAVPVIHAHDGHVDKFVGDGLLAVFGAPRRQEDHADQALSAAVEIVREVADEFGDELSIGVGLNSGAVVAGNVGGGGRLEFSVIGDVVNVAARVEAATRETGDAILVSEHTRGLLRQEGVELQEREAVPLKGKTETVALFAPRDGAGA